MVVMCLGIAGLTAGLLRHHHRDEMAYWKDRQVSIIADRQRLAENWLSERRADAREFAASPALLAASGRTGRAAARQRLAQLRAAHDFTAVCLDLPGAEVLAAPAGSELCPRGGPAGEAIAAVQGVAVRLAGESPDRSLLGFTAPLALRGAPRPGPAAITFWLSPAKSLFADLATDAVATRTGETFLVYRDSARDEAVYLSPLRNRPRSQPRLRRPLAAAGPPVQAALAGRRTFSASRDYRGETVLASTDRLPLTGWGIVRKIDRGEAMAGFRRLAAVGCMAALALAGGFCGLIWAFWQRRRQSWLAQSNSALLRELADAGRIARLNRVYTVLSAVNHAIVRARGRAELVETACRVTAERGGFPLVWAGFADPADGRVEPAALTGSAAPRFAGHRVSARDVPEGRGLSGRAIREARAVVVRDFRTDPGMEPWRSRLAAAGLRSGAAFPLILDGRAVGVLSIAASEAGFFDEMEVKLLAELAMDLSYALEKLAEEARRRQAEEALRTERDRLETVTRHAGVGLAVFSREHRTVWANQVMQEIFGDAVGRTCREIFGLGTGAESDCIIAESFATGAPRLERELAGRSGGGRRIWSQIIASPLLGPDGAVDSVLLAVVPTTERKVLEEQLRQAQKMEAVGRLAGGVAHDFNNILTAIRGYAELLTEDIPTADKRHKDAGEILLAADRASALTRQLLAFSRKQVLAPRVLDLNEAAADIAGLLRRLIGENIRLVLAPAPDLGLVRVDPSQLEQVLINLAVNARDAMPRGGTLTIATRGDASGVTLEVSDTGQGMDEQTLSHAFEPFFTTKPKGRGTGMGLSTVFGIVKQSGGDISARSRPGGGTAFTIQFPRCEAAKSPKASPEPAAAPGGGETVLVVEDEAPVRALAERFLSRQGYTVWSAADGESALRIAQDRAAPLHLLLTDVVMPGLGGPELARRLCALRPGLKVLYISGYSEEAVQRRGSLGPGAAFLAKPFSRGRLLRKVRETLGQRTGVRWH